MPRKRGEKTFFSSQKAAEIIFMNSENEGEDVDLGEDICGDSDFDTGSEYALNIYIYILSMRLLQSVSYQN